MYFLSSKDSVNSLLHWVIAGLGDLDHEAALADSQSLDQALASPNIYPSYRPMDLFDSKRVPGTGPDSPPLEPAKLADETLLEQTEGNGSPGTPLNSASRVGLGQGLESKTTQNDASRARSVSFMPHGVTSHLMVDQISACRNRDTHLGSVGNR